MADLKALNEALGQAAVRRDIAQGQYEQATQQYNQIRQAVIAEMNKPKDAPEKKVLPTTEEPEKKGE